MSGELMGQTPTCEYCWENLIKPRNAPNDSTENFHRIVKTDCCHRLLHLKCANKWIRESRETHHRDMRTLFRDLPEEAIKMTSYICGICQVREYNCAQVPEYGQEIDLYSTIYVGSRVILSSYQECDDCVKWDVYYRHDLQRRITSDQENNQLRSLMTKKDKQISDLSQQLEKSEHQYKRLTDTIRTAIGSIKPQEQPSNNQPPIPDEPFDPNNGQILKLKEDLNQLREIHQKQEKVMMNYVIAIRHELNEVLLRNQQLEQAGTSIRELVSKIPPRSRE